MTSKLEVKFSLLFLNDGAISPGHVQVINMAFRVYGLFCTYMFCEGCRLRQTTLRCLFGYDVMSGLGGNS